MSTLVPITMREVVAPSAPSQASENGAWPPVCRQGWKWSLTKTESKPTLFGKHREMQELARAELLG